MSNEFGEPNSCSDDKGVLLLSFPIIIHIVHAIRIVHTIHIIHLRIPINLENQIRVHAAGIHSLDFDIIHAQELN